MSDASFEPQRPLGNADVLVTLESRGLVTVRPESGTDRLWLREEGSQRSLLLLSKEPQVCPIGRPLHFLALAGTFEGFPVDVRTVRVLLNRRTDPIEGTSSDRAWIVLLPIEEVRQRQRIGGEIIWYDNLREPYRRRALQSLRAFMHPRRAGQETRGTAYGPTS